MKINLLLIPFILLGSLIFTAGARELTHNEKIAIANLKDNIRNGRIESVLDQVDFPLIRSSYPRYLISKDEFKERYNDIFDSDLKNRFIESDWYFYYGLLMNDAGFTGHFNEDGVLILDNIPLSDKEWLYINTLVEQEKQFMHESVRDFKCPVLELSVGKYLIRIDLLYDGSIRYACWDKGKDQSVKPALVLYNGEYSVERAYASYCFINNEYEYFIQEGIYGCYFTVSNSKKELLSYDDVVNDMIFKFYPSYDFSFSRECYMLRTYSDEAMEERGLL